MTVKELIEKLKTFDPSYRVDVCDGDEVYDIRDVIKDTEPVTWDENYGPVGEMDQGSITIHLK